jgi:hypothetical protein
MYDEEQSTHSTDSNRELKKTVLYYFRRRKELITANDLAECFTAVLGHVRREGIRVSPSQPTARMRASSGARNGTRAETNDESFWGWDATRRAHLAAASRELESRSHRLAPVPAVVTVVAAAALPALPNAQN